MLRLSALRRHKFGSPAGRLATVARLAIAASIACGGVHVARAHPAPEPAAETGDVELTNPYRPGVVARYTGSDGVEHARLQDEVSLACDQYFPDPRVPPGPVTARFTAQLLVQSPGVHRLRVYAAGAVQLTVAGKKVLDARAAEPAWLDGESIDLPYGYHALEVRYERREEPGRLTLFWEGPNFHLEPLAARWLFHERGQTPSDEFDRGRRLARALRCAACHTVPDEPNALPAPALDRLAGNLSRTWLVDRLTFNSSKKAHVKADGLSQRMPHFALDRHAAEAVADYLLHLSAKSPAVKPAGVVDRLAVDGKHPPGEANPQETLPTAEAGGTLFRSIGCLACHRVGELGADGLFGGGDLSQAAAKRPRDYFARWLTDPAASNRDHRMPVFSLTPWETESLSLYLQSLGEPTSEAGIASTGAARGAELVHDLRCGACHTLPTIDQPRRERLPLDVARLHRTLDNCLAEADPAGHRPGYSLSDPERRALTAYLLGIATSSKSPPPAILDGRDLLVERNCLACHARGHERGLAPQLTAMVDADSKLRDMAGDLNPPSLVGVGDKLRDDALAAAIRATDRPRYTWLRVRMPKFPLADEEVATLVRHFVDADRVPQSLDGAPRPSVGSDSAIEAAGARLVTADGFGCTSCHAIGKWQPQKVAAGAEGIDLSQLGRRVRREWFVRWVRNPARTGVQLEMPSLVQPIRGVLDANLDRQIAAIWDVLDRKNFTPPAPGALRTVRRANLPGVVEPAAVLTDVIEIGETPFVKPLVVGLPNRHNVLLDLATGRLAAWWTGDTARQRTRGKSWYWEAGVPQLLPLDDMASETAASDLVLVHGDKRLHAVPRGQYVTEFDRFQHVEQGVEVAYRLLFQLNGGAVTVRVVERYVALPAGESSLASGFRRSVHVEGLPAGSSAELLALGGKVNVDANGRRATLTRNGTGLQVDVDASAARFTKASRGAVVKLADAGESTQTCEIEYRADLVVDQFAPLPEVDRRLTRAELTVVPGFDAVRLPVTDQVMPTGLAWRGDGTLVVTSLEGRVWLGHDTDGDGLEDRLAPLSDDLAAPWGAAAVLAQGKDGDKRSSEPIDVINKFGLVRLFDADDDGRADRTELLASGWGHTSDYHDWAIGLPRDAAGNYYVSLPCQQDDRSEAAAVLRGTVVKLSPREPTDDDPRRFSIETLCGGLRFGQGIALSPAGELFVTDNQGNYTPFNELNHVVKGARYGFINRLESKRGLNPPFEPAAIEIPHPWTRSVNGICFLPQSRPGDPAGERFGPLAGQLVGCEYDTRRLVRMSLERVGNAWQGAVYPLSIEPEPGQETFEGPLACQVSPAGDLYVGNIRDSGWGGGTNTGSLVRLRWRGDLSPGIAEVRGRPDGFQIEFTQAVDPARAADVANYAVSSYRRIPTPSYGAPDADQRVETIDRVEVGPDARSATIHLKGLREGYVYEFHVRDLAGAERWFPGEAYYTLKRVVSGQ